MRVAKLFFAFTIFITSTSFHLLHTSHTHKVLAMVEDSLFFDQDKGTDEKSDNSLIGFQTYIAKSDKISAQLDNHTFGQEQLPSYLHYLVTVFYQGNYTGSIVVHLIS